MRLAYTLLLSLAFIAGCKTDSTSVGLEETTQPPVPAAPAFEAHKIALADKSPEAEAIRVRMKKGGSMKSGCPVGFEKLAYLKIRHVTFEDGKDAMGELVVHADHADAMIEVFRSLYAHKYPIASMRLIDEFGADDTRSMDANNTSAFNCRKVTGSTNKWSQHSNGNAIDINPIQNPYVKGTFVSPAAGKDYLKRDVAKKGMILKGDPVVAAFHKAGWKWGGDWKSPKDYQHFSSNGL